MNGYNSEYKKCSYNSRVESAAEKAALELFPSKINLCVSVKRGASNSFFHSVFEWVKVVFLVGCLLFSVLQLVLFSHFPTVRFHMGGKTLQSNNTFLNSPNFFKTFFSFS